ncbi:hypothetical protein FDA94_04745 [Herbidospora galbida]|uniref:Uncharacterized protein n=1 Tax=Herbidospora galbida TaxID=2575442 RepID=A0A4U3MPN6_9ACTN|nr:hypothetical protein [Herbidospora galbida]TKK91060.1 hypothetical protein FDA94_04745 [Herbidospora galbida]
MRRILAIAACTAAITAVGAAPAQAAPNPVAALKTQYKTGYGVKYSDTFRRGTAIFSRRTGTFQFGRAGVTASDISSRFPLKAADMAALPEHLRAVLKPERVIKIGATAYIKGGFLATFLPGDKTWLRFPGGPAAGVPGVFGQLINPLEATTLQRLLQKSNRVGSVYVGKITLGELWTSSKWLQGFGAFGGPSPAQKRAALSFKLYVNAKGLVTRIVTTTKASTVGLTGPAVSADSRFVSWGTKVSVKPPADGVVDRDDVDFQGLDFRRAKPVGRVAA